MRSNRLEAFSDGVLAIVITIMVLELTVPEDHSLAALWHTSGLGLLTYLLSFVYVGIYWNNTTTCSRSASGWTARCCGPI